MNDLYLNGVVSDICSTVGHGSSDFNLMENQLYKRNDVANFDAEWTLDFLSETIGLFSSMDCIFGRLMNLTCYISHKFIHFIEDLVFRDNNGYSDYPEDIFYRKNITSSNNCSSTSSKFGNVGTRSGTCDKVVHDFEEEAHVNTRPYIVQINHSYLSISSLFQGLMLPVFGFRLVWKLVCTSWRCYFCYLRRAQVRVQSIISRVQKTLRGSADDIGWLQDSPGMAPVADGTPRFTELLQGIRNGVHKLPNSYVYLLIPGLFSNHGPLYFVNTKKFFSKMGLTCHIAKIHSEASVERNALELKQYIEELHWGSGKRVMLLGHSKGGVDAAAALSIYSSELKDKVAGLALVQSPYGGTPLASDILREGQIADKETRRIMEFFICNIIKGDIRALEDLTYEKRKEFIMKHKLPEQIPLISFHSEANIALGVIATMTHIAHAELPWFPVFGRENESEDSGQAAFTVSVKLPVSAAMAVCALHLQLRYGEKSDGLVTCRDAEVPGSVVVRPNWKLDHAWMVYSSMRKDHDDPDASEMCEALLTMLVELGNVKKASH